MGLHVERHGTGPRLVLVHGFTQTGRSWGPLAEDLARDHEVVLPDAPGHGGSGTVAADLPGGADLLADLGGIATYIGYSMGARLCLHVALRHPSHIRGLVLVSGTAGLDAAADRTARVAQDRATAARLEDLGVDAFLEEWLDQPMFSGVPTSTAGREDRRRNTVAGLQSSLELAGTGTQAPLWDHLGALTAPVLVVAGARDEKFAALGERMADAIGANAELVLVPEAGHAVHLEQPVTFLAAVRRWLAANGS